MAFTKRELAFLVEVVDKHSKACISTYEEFSLQYKNKKISEDDYFAIQEKILTELNISDSVLDKIDKN